MKNQPILLSICIPNYNRATYLFENVSAIAKQINSKSPVEVVVSDDNSKENIDKVIRDLKKIYPYLKLKYLKNSKNLGFDKNVLRVVTGAKGKYCWLLSNDDLIKTGGIDRILREIDQNKNTKLILVNYERFDKLLKKTTAVRMINSKKDLSFEDFNKFWFKRVYGSYFRALGVNTITMSCNVFERKSWIKTMPTAGSFIGYNFIHVFFVSKIATMGTISYIHSPLVRYLANNHRTWPNDIWKDYNSILMNYLISIGYDEKLTNKLRAEHREYEARESLTKNKLVTFVYRLIYPVFARMRSVYAK